MVKLQENSSILVSEIKQLHKLLNFLVELLDLFYLSKSHLRGSLTKFLLAALPRFFSNFLPFVLRAMV